MAGRRIVRAEVRRPDLRWPFPPRMAERLTGRRVEALRRRSKYLLADLDGGETLIAHLGMSGRMLVSGETQGVFHHPAPAAQKHDHVVLEIEGGARVTFNDARRFGAMDLWPTASLDAHRMLARLGPEPLGNGFDAAVLAAAFAGRIAPVKAMLLDQSVVAGLGNIYVCEALWRAEVAPARAAGSVTVVETEALAAAVRAVLDAAIAAGGSSLRDYRQADGELGYFQHTFAVYGRAGASCTREGCDGVIARLVQSGRSSFFCPVCQRT